MKNTVKTLLALLVFAPFLSIGQTLFIQNTVGTSNSFPLQDVQSIKFNDNDLIIYLNSGNFGAFDIADIDFYKIEVEEDTTTNVAENKLTEQVNIFPNPASDQLNIDFKSQVSGNISIEITDMTGRKVDEVFRGKHQEETFITWDYQGKSIQAGQYLCVIKTDTGVISKPITLK